MSYQNFVKAMALAPQCKFYTTAGGKSLEEIKKSEELLGITFSKQCTEFYKNYGYLSFWGNEIYGIDPDDTSGILAGNSVTCALCDRKKQGLPKEWIPIYDFDDGFMAYFDYNSLNTVGEPRVIMGIYNGETYEHIQTIAEDFGDFLLQIVQQQIDSQNA